MNPTRPPSQFRRGGVRLRRLPALLALLALLPALVGGTAPATASPAEGVTAAARARTVIGIGELYVALGDSLGVGLLSSLPDQRGYVAQVHGLLQGRAGRPVAVENFSISGETARSMLAGAQLDNAIGAIEAAQARGWRVSPITIDIGGNDLRALAPRDDAAREAGLVQFRADIAIIFDRLAAATTRDGVRGSDILTMTVYNPYGGDPAVRGSDAWWVERFNSTLAEEAARRDIGVAGVYERFRGQERVLTYVPLDFHANNRGHRAIAEAFWQASGYDVSPPGLEIVEPAGASLPRAVPTIKVRAADDIGIARVDFLIDDTPLPPPVFEPGLGLHIGYWDARGATPGPHRLTVVVADAAGNETRREMVLTR